MKITNKYNLPEPIYKACQMDTHRTHGDISVTTLIDAPQIRYLKRKHNDVLEQDVSEMLWALQGTAMHAILERANIELVRERAFDLTLDTLENFLKEVGSMTLSELVSSVLSPLRNLKNYIFKKLISDDYLFETTLNCEINGMVVSGTFDLYHKPTFKLQDYKNVSVWAYIYPESRKKFIRQLNIYAYMLRLQGYKVKSASVILMFRDWDMRSAKTNKDYPQVQTLELEIPLYSQEEVYKVIAKRVELHKAADIDNVAECTGEERWATADKYAVMAEGLKRAKIVLDHESDANKYIEENKHKTTKMWVEKRPGESKRCNEYCLVREFCPQRKEAMRKLVEEI